MCIRDRANALPESRALGDIVSTRDNDHDGGHTGPGQHGTVVVAVADGKGGRCV